ncbi:MAG TPA: GNAT family protein [Prolixibacteraceae bacterium]
MKPITNFEFTKKIILEDDRAVLRPLEYPDFENLLRFSITEPEIWKYSLVRAAGEKGLRNYINIAVEQREANKEYPFIVFDKLQNSYAGSTRFYDIQLSNKCLQIGYTWYGKQFQGTGLNKHCKYLLLEFAFEKMGMERVEFRADTQNERSIAAMKSIGCKVEGILRSTGLRPDGIRRNSIVLSILREEWDGTVKEELRKKLSI